MAFAWLASPASAETRPRYEDGAAGTFLPFLNAPARGEEAERSPRLGLSFGGEARPVLMDTGSTGIVVSASRIPDVDSLPARPGRLTYTSSGRIMIGRWVTVPVTLWGRDEARVTTRPIPVLAVDRIDCTEQARDCTPEEAPAHVAMMGVGFGREGDAQSQSTPDTNPLLNLDPGGRRLHRGYVVTKEGVHVGLTPANTRGEFRFVKLDPHPDIAGDWLGVPACIAVDAGPSACGRGLVDTGVTGMFLTMPREAVAGSLEDGRPALSPGSRVAIRFPQASGADAPAAASYAFAVGDDGSALAPSRVVLNTRRPQTFVNTGLHLLNGFDVLYDADGGFYAFRQRPAP
ncbi:hypothetical protein [Enterovirga rhinocerotis]|uniref:hypothetical protein n=1 Tax=Enterovirga rhinocerotis TaxID=1339210 RepID=UPI00315C7C4D